MMWCGIVLLRVLTARNFFKESNDFLNVKKLLSNSVLQEIKTSRLEL